MFFGFVGFWGDFYFGYGCLDYADVIGFLGEFGI